MPAPKGGREGTGERGRRRRFEGRRLFGSEFGTAKGFVGACPWSGRMRTAREVLNELRWRQGRDLSRAEIWIADRRSPSGGRVLSGAKVTDLGRRYFTTARATIPFYKIVKITYGGRTLFERREPQETP